MSLSRSGTIWQDDCESQDAAACRCFRSSEAQHSKMQEPGILQPRRDELCCDSRFTFPGKTLQTRWSFSREPFSDKKTRGQTDGPESESSEPRNCFRLSSSSKNTHQLLSDTVPPSILNCLALIINRLIWKRMCSSKWNGNVNGI